MQECDLFLAGTAHWRAALSARTAGSLLAPRLGKLDAGSLVLFPGLGRRFDQRDSKHRKLE